MARTGGEQAASVLSVERIDFFVGHA